MIAEMGKSQLLNGHVNVNAEISLLSALLLLYLEPLKVVVAKKGNMVIPTRNGYTKHGKTCDADVLILKTKDGLIMVGEE